MKIKSLVHFALALMFSLTMFTGSSALALDIGGPIDDGLNGDVYSIGSGPIDDGLNGEARSSEGPTDDGLNGE